jgi:hypothetical protein
VTSVADAGSRPRRGTGERGDLSPTWPRVAVVVAVLLLAFFVARSCQESQIRITKEQAIATAEREVDFTSENTQIRLLRQGLDSKPFWIVSLSIPKGESQGMFSRLALVRVDANTGEVANVREQDVKQGKQR